MLSRPFTPVLFFWAFWNAAQSLVSDSVSPGSALCQVSGKAVGTILPACSSLQTTYVSCSNLYVGKPSSKSALNECICQQALFDNIYDCENEWRACLLSDEADQAVNSILTEWHRECDTFVTFSPTTPKLIQPSTMLGNSEICESMASVCEVYGQSISSCEIAYSATLKELSSCICKSQYLSAASVCLYDEAITCQLHSTALSAIPLFSLCPAQASTFLASRSASAPSTSALPTSSSRVGPAPSLSSRSSSASPKSTSSKPTPSPTKSPQTTNSSGGGKAIGEVPRKVSSLWVGWLLCICEVVFGALGVVL